MRTGASRSVAASASARALFSAARRACQLPSAMKAAQPAAASASEPHRITMRRERKEYPRSMLRYFVIGVFLLILASLASALVFIYRDKGGSTRALKALALRVG